MGNIYDDLSEVRSPRVHIRFDVHTDGAEPKNDLPFVVGVMGDLTGDPTGKLEPLAQRKFVKINRDTFDQVMKRMKPGLSNLEVKNTLKKGGKDFNVSLKFDSMESFEPGSIIEQVTPLKELMAIRNKLHDLMTKADRSPRLEALLEEVLQDESKRNDLARELGIDSTGGETGDKENAE